MTIAREKARPVRCGSGEMGWRAGRMRSVSGDRTESDGKIRKIDAVAVCRRCRQMRCHDRGGNMGRRSKRAFVMDVTAVFGGGFASRILLRMMAGSVHRADGESGGPGWIGHPADRQQGTQQHGCYGKVNGGQPRAGHGRGRSSRPCERSSNQNVAALTRIVGKGAKRGSGRPGGRSSLPGQIPAP